MLDFTYNQDVRSTQIWYRCVVFQEPTRFLVHKAAVHKTVPINETIVQPVENNVIK